MAENTTKFFDNIPNIKESLKNRSLFLEIFFAVFIISVLVYVIVAILNPSEMIKQSRDSQRIVEMIDLSQAINIEKVESGNKDFGLVKTVYISIPYDSSDCGYPLSNPLGLPELSPGWSYHCAPTASFRNVDGSGWVPLNLSNVTASFKMLPIDPINNPSSSLFYSYYPGIGGYKVSARLESKKHCLDGKTGNLSVGSRNKYGILEKGTDLNIAR